MKLILSSGRLASNTFWLIFNYSPSDLSIVNNGPSVQVNYDAGSSIELDGEAFNLLQFHMHFLSEHTLNGEHFPVEIHLVHQADSGQLAVVGILIEEGEANEVLLGVWSDMQRAGSLAHSDQAYHTLSADQLATFTSIFDSNFRPVQPLNACTIVVNQANN